MRRGGSKQRQREDSNSRDPVSPYDEAIRPAAVRGGIQLSGVAIAAAVVATLALVGGIIALGTLYGIELSKTNNAACDASAPDGNTTCPVGSKVFGDDGRDLLSTEFLHIGDQQDAFWDMNLDNSPGTIATSKRLSLEEHGNHIVCVDQKATTLTENGTGECWTDPFLDFQTALDYAWAHLDDICAIWVATGTYAPSVTYTPLDSDGFAVVGGLFSVLPGLDLEDNVVDYDDDSELFDALLRTFYLPPGVDIYGSFGGQLLNEQATDERNLTDFEAETILSGDLGDDFFVWHVVTMGNDVDLTVQGGGAITLDGIVIQDASCLDAPGSVSADNWPVIEDEQVDTFRYAHWAGGLVHIASRTNLTLNGVQFYNSEAFSGAGLLAWDGSIVRMYGGAMYQLFAVFGGAIAALGGGPNSVDHYDLVKRTRVDIASTVFLGNFAYFGGVIFAIDLYYDPTGAVDLRMAWAQLLWQENVGPTGASIVMELGVVNILDTNAMFNEQDLFYSTIMSFFNLRANITGGFFLSNECNDDTAPCAGVISVQGCSTIVRGAVFMGNAGWIAGAITCSIRDDLEDWTLPMEEQQLQLYHNTFSENLSYESGSGAGAVFAQCPVIALGNTFVANTGDRETLYIDEPNDGALLIEQFNVFCSNVPDDIGGVSPCGFGMGTSC